MNQGEDLFQLVSEIIDSGAEWHRESKSVPQF